MLAIDSFLGHTASQARVLVQLPKPSSSIFAIMFLARLAASGRPWGSIFAGGHAGAAADAGGAVHGLVGRFLGNQDGVGVLSLACSDGVVTAGGNDFVESRAVHHAVFDDRESGRTPGFDGNDVAVVEAAHVELAGGGAAFGLSVRRAVDVERAHAADALAAVVVENERLLAGLDELFVENVEHFEE